MHTKHYGRTIFTISIAAYLVLDHVGLTKTASEGKRQIIPLIFFFFLIIVLIEFSFSFFFQ